MKRLTFLILIVGATALNGFAQIFVQNFSGSTVVSDYIGTTSNLFTAISGGAANVATINSGQLNFTKTGGNTGYFVRNIDFNSSFLKIAFDFTVSAQAASGTTQATFYIGSGFANNATAPTVAQTHSKFAINFASTVGSFSIRDLNSGTNSAAFGGRQTITFVANNTGSLVTYVSPNGTNATVANDTWDLWIGTNNEFNDRALGSSGTATVDLKNFKFIFPSGSTNAILDFDNIIIQDQTDPSTTLPITLTSFSGKAIGKHIDLHWKTASETNNSHFDILRATAGQPFKKIGNVKGAGTTQIAQRYIFTDINPLPGVNYYQLNQVDLNGTATLSDPVSAVSNITVDNFKIVANADHTAIDLTIFVADGGDSAFSIHDLNGRKVLTKKLNLNKGYNTFSLPTSAGSGIHVATLTTGTKTMTTKFLRQ